MKVEVIDYQKSFFEELGRNVQTYLVKVRLRFNWFEIYLLRCRNGDFDIFWDGVSWVHADSARPLCRSSLFDDKIIIAIENHQQICWNRKRMERRLKNLEEAKRNIEAF